MKPLILCGLFALALAVAAPAPGHAAASPLEFGFLLGIAEPLGDLGDAAKLGFDFGVMTERTLTPAFAWGGTVVVNRHGLKDVPGALGGGNLDGSFTIVGVGPHLTFWPGSGGDSRPFARVGLGVYHVRTHISATSVIRERDDSDTEFGIHVGGGLSRQLTPGLRGGIEGAYHSVFTDRATTYLNLGVFALFGGGR